MMAYDDYTVTDVPKFRLWDGSAWGEEQSANPVNGEIAHMTLKYGTTRDETILVTSTVNGLIQAQVFDGTYWGDVTTIATLADTGGVDISMTQGQPFDLAYESVSGDAVLVYRDGTADPNYAIWNGSAWDNNGGTGYNIDVPTTGIPRMIELERGPNDQIAMILNDANSDVYGALWTGSAWDDMNSGAVEPVWDATAAGATKHNADVAWESLSGDALFIWGDTTLTDHYYRTYSGGVLSAATLLDIAAQSSGGGVAHWLNVDADPSSDKIMLGVLDAGSELNTVEWDGNGSWVTPTEHSSATEDIADRNFDLVYESSGSAAVLVYGNGSTVTRKRYSGGSWTTQGTAGDDTAYIDLELQPNSGKLLYAGYEDNTSASDDLVTANSAGGGAAWSAQSQLWTGPVARNLGFDRVDVATQAFNGSTEAMVVYERQDAITSTPKYRIWDGTAWGPPAAANDVTGEIAHTALKFNSKRDEGILVTQSTSGHIQSQVWNGSGWGPVKTHQIVTGNGAGADQQALNGQSFDLAYESVSGDAVLVYYDNTADPNYAIWNGTAWDDNGGAGYNLDVPTTGQPNVIELERGPDDQIAMILVDSNIDIYGALWNGTAWDDMNPSGVEPVWDATGSIATKHPIDVTFESLSGDIMFLWGDATLTDHYYRTYSGGVLSAATLLDIAAQSSGGGIAHWLNLDADPSSDKIMLGVLDAGVELNTVEWNGNGSWVSPTEHTSAAEDIVDRNFDLVYETHPNNPSDAWLVYGNGSTVTRKKWDNGAWGTSTTTGDDTAFVELEAQPQSGAILAAVYEDNTSNTDDILSFQLTGGGTTWSTPNTQIWGGQVRNNYGFDKIDIGYERYVGPTVPGAPTIGTATAGNGQATVTFTPPASDGGSSITGYTVTSTPGGFTGTGSGSPITVTGLSNGTPYTFTV
ncbi:MAG: fibronectin type III domain-containing protein, partial [Candidatus Saccharibacteria bacterium]